MKILFAGGGSGSGIAVNRKTNKETFMKMVEVQAGLGIGVKKFRLVWVFETQGALDKFVSQGWELGAQATAAAQMSGQGKQAYAGAMSVSPGVWLYQLTDDGLAAAGSRSGRLGRTGVGGRRLGRRFLLRRRGGALLVAPAARGEQRPGDGQ